MNLSVNYNAAVAQQLLIYKLKSQKIYECDITAQQYYQTNTIKTQQATISETTRDRTHALTFISRLGRL